MIKSKKFRQLMADDHIIVAPGVPTPLFARLVEEAGYEVVNVTGAGVSNMNFCLPDYGLVTMTENLEIIKRINDATSLPLIVDCDDGYGGGLNTYRTVKEVSSLDVGALFIEDQASPKRCGHFEDHRVIPVAAMQGKIKAAKDASRDPDLFVIARTDAISAEGSLDRALDRAHAYVEAGADAIFIEAPTTVEELRRIPRELDVPAVANLVESGKTPMLKNSELQELGFKIVFYGNAVLKASMFGVMNILKYLKENDTTAGADDLFMIPSAKRHEVLKKEQFKELLKKYQG